MVELSVISKMVAEKIHQGLITLPGAPSENRLVICSSEEKFTKSGIIVPDQVEEGISKKGVIVQIGPISEEYRVYKEMLSIGDIVFYGDYAGKELNINIEGVPKGHRLRVLSINELVYMMGNN